MTELDEKIKAIASEAFYDGNACGGEIPKWLINAIYAGIRAFAEQEPSEGMAVAFVNSYTEITMPAQTWPQRLNDAYEKMMAEAIKALPNVA